MQIWGDSKCNVLALLLAVNSCFVVADQAAVDEVAAERDIDHGRVATQGTPMPALTGSIDLALIPLSCKRCHGVYALYLRPPINPVGLEREQRLQEASVILSGIEPTDAGEHEFLHWEWSSQKSCTEYEFGNLLFASDEVLQNHATTKRAESTCFFPFLRYDKAVVISPSGIDADSALSPELLQAFLATKTFKFRERVQGESRVCPYVDESFDLPEEPLVIGTVKVFSEPELNGISRLMLNDHAVFRHPETDDAIRIFGLGSTYHGPLRVGESFSGFWHRLDSGKVLLALPGEDPANPRRVTVDFEMHEGSPSFELDGQRYVGQPEGGC